MRKAILAVPFVAMAIWGAIVLIQAYAEDPEPNTSAPEQDPEPAPERAEAIVSDPTLLVPQLIRIQETARSSDGTILENAPFFILLKDGRYAFGYTNTSGETTPIFAREAVDHQVYFYEEAWNHLRATDAGR